MLKTHEICRKSLSVLPLRINLLSHVGLLIEGRKNADTNCIAVNSDLELIFKAPQSKNIISRPSTVNESHCAYNRDAVVNILINTADNKQSTVEEGQNDGGG